MKGKGKKKELVEYPFEDGVSHVSRLANWMCDLKPDYVIEVDGQLISKKNGYSPRANGKGFFKGSKITNAEQMVSLQIPGELRDLKLENPHILVQRKVPKKSWRSDADNGWTFLQDCLVKCGVLSSDSINHMNGYVLHTPVIESKDHKCLISIWRNDETE